MAFAQFLSGRKLAWTAEAWDDYLYWQSQDRKTLKRINLLIEDTLRTTPLRESANRKR